MVIYLCVVGAVVGAVTYSKGISQNSKIDYSYYTFYSCLWNSQCYYAHIAFSQANKACQIVKQIRSRKTNKEQ